MDSPTTPQAQGRRSDTALPGSAEVDTVARQLHAVTISRPPAAERKREQTAPTPASQARPRTQRRTMPASAQHPEAEQGGQDSQQAPDQQALAEAAVHAGQEPAAASTGNAAAGEKAFTPSRLNCISELRDELSCGICLEICVRPCATPCGHNFCRACLRQALQHKRQCPQCREVVPPAARWQPKVNTALWNTIQLLFPQHAASAPPPTPPGGLPAAAAGGAAGAARGRRAAVLMPGAAAAADAGAGAGGWVEEPGQLALQAATTRAAAARALEAAGTVQDTIMGGAEGGSGQGHVQTLRQPFRPPRFTGFSSQLPPGAGSQQRRSQQRQATGGSGSSQSLHMEPELVNLLRGMAPAAARVSSHSRALRGAAAGAAEGSAAAGTGRWGWQQQQQQQSEALSEDERLLQEMLGTFNADSDVWNTGSDSDSGSGRRRDARQVSQPAGAAVPGSQAAAAGGAGSRRSRGQAAVLSRRSGRAAAAAVAGAELRQQLSEEELLLQQVMLDSLAGSSREQQGGSSTHHGSTGDGSRAGVAGRRMVAAGRSSQGLRTRQQQFQQQGQAQAAAAATGGEAGGVPGFGHIHSGSSPRQFWADLGDAPEPDWLLLDSPRGANNNNQASSAAAAAAGVSLLAEPAPQGQQQQQQGTAGQQLGRAARHAFAAAIAHVRGSAGASQAMEDLGALMEDWDVPDLHTDLQQQSTPRLQLHSSHTHEQQQGLAPAEPAGDARACHRRRGNPIISSDDDSDDGLEGRDPGDAAGIAAGAAQHAAASAARAAAAGRSSSSSQQGAVGLRVGGTSAGASASAASAPAPSPEPQPLRSRLAHFAGGSDGSRQHINALQQQPQQQQQPLQQLLRGQQVSLVEADASSPLARAAVTLQATVAESLQQSRAAAAFVEVQQAQPSQQQQTQVAAVSDDEDDDFQPRNINTRTRLTAARAAAAMGAAGGSRRVVPGLRGSSASMRRQHHARG